MKSDRLTTEVEDVANGAESKSVAIFLEDILHYPASPLTDALTAFFGKYQLIPTVRSFYLNLSHDFRHKK